jgi:hypothetical protein
VAIVVLVTGGCGEVWAEDRLPNGCYISAEATVQVRPLVLDAPPLVQEVWNVTCPGASRYPNHLPPRVLDGGAPPVVPPADAGLGPTDAGQTSQPPPDDADTYVRYNANNGKCYKLNQAQIDSTGKHRGWAVVSTDEVVCP